MFTIKHGPFAGTHVDVGDCRLPVNEGTDGLVWPVEARGQLFREVYKPQDGWRVLTEVQDLDERAPKVDPKSKLAYRDAETGDLLTFPTARITVSLLHNETIVEQVVRDVVRAREEDLGRACGYARGDLYGVLGLPGFFRYADGDPRPAEGAALPAEEAGPVPGATLNAAAKTTAAGAANGSTVAVKDPMSDVKPRESSITRRSTRRAVDANPAAKNDVSTQAKAPASTDQPKTSLAALNASLLNQASMLAQRKKLVLPSFGSNDDVLSFLAENKG